MNRPGAPTGGTQNIGSGDDGVEDKSDTGEAEEASDDVGDNSMQDSLRLLYLASALSSGKLPTDGGTDEERNGSGDADEEDVEGALWW